MLLVVIFSLCSQIGVNSLHGFLSYINISFLVFTGLLLFFQSRFVLFLTFVRY